MEIVDSLLQHPEVAARLRSAFPSNLASDVDVALRVIPVGMHEPHRDIGRVRVAGEDIRIPSRIYSFEPDDDRASSLSGTPRTILASLYTRHHDGHVRERYVVEPLPSPEEWVAPFVLQLVGEYVVEIIQLIARNLPILPKDPYRRFASENPGFLRITSERALSYWECHYRSDYRRLRDYPGFQVLDALGMWSRSAGRRLTDCRRTDEGAPPCP